MSSVEERFWAKVIKTPACWWWMGAVADDGYGRFTVEGAAVRPHRWHLEAVEGRLGELYALHGCDETLCVRLGPDHVYAGTQAQNQADMARRGRAAGPHHSGVGDTRGAVGRARAVQAALRDGYDAARLAEALSAGSPDRVRPRLFDVAELPTELRYAG